MINLFKIVGNYLSNKSLPYKVDQFISNVVRFRVDETNDMVTLIIMVSPDLYIHSLVYVKDTVVFSKNVNINNFDINNGKRININFTSIVCKQESTQEDFIKLLDECSKEYLETKEIINLQGD